MDDACREVQVRSADRVVEFMSSRFVYVVFGERGEYSDWDYWAVAAYPNRREAEKHARAANEWATAYDLEEDTGGDVSPYDDQRTAYKYEKSEYNVVKIPVGWKYPKA